MSALEDFGPFADVFSVGELDAPGYLKLLWLKSPESQVVIDRVQRALEQEPAQPWIDVLFGDVNWRPHLVGAVALLLDGGERLTPASLWQAVDAGSWVTPQLVVTAFFVDPDFPARCRERIRGGAPVTLPSGLSFLEKHSATGPAGAHERSAKLLASLVAVGRRVPSLADWIDGQCARPELAGLLAEDVDAAPDICDEWRARLLEQFEQRGVPLVPAAR